MWKKTHDERMREERRKQSGSYGSGGQYLGTISFNDGLEVMLHYSGGVVTVDYTSGSSKKVGFFEDDSAYCRAIENAVRDFARNNGISMPSIHYYWKW